MWPAPTTSFRCALAGRSSDRKVSALCAAMGLAPNADGLLENLFAVCAFESDGAAHACYWVYDEADGFGWNR